MGSISPERLAEGEAVLQREKVSSEPEESDSITNESMESGQCNGDLKREDNNDIAMVLLDIETSGFERDCDILQIAAKYDDRSFEIYVRPVQAISFWASEANGLTQRNGELMYRGQHVPSEPISVALTMLHEWLTSIGKMCCIATHNLTFDGPRLMANVRKCSLEEKFSEVVYGFVDTLSVIKNKTGRGERREPCSISKLANALGISAYGAHNATRDCAILSEIVKAFAITTQDLLTNSKTFGEQTDIWKTQQRIAEIKKTLEVMKNTIGASIRKKLASAELDIETLNNSYALYGADEFAQFVQNKMTEKRLGGMKIESINKIISFLQQRSN